MYIFLLGFLLSFMSLNVNAQQKKSAFVYRNDNAINAFACNNIDSITYERDNETEIQVIWTADNIYRIPLESIDSVCFDTPKNIIFQIPEEDLNGWEVGLSLGEEYIVAYIDDSDSTLVLMANKIGADEKNGLIMCLNESTEIIRVGNMDRLYDVRYEDNKMILYRFNEEGLYEETVISIPNDVRARTAPRKALSLSSIYEVVNKIVEYVGYIQSGVAIRTDVMNEDWKGAAIEGGWLLVGFAVKDNIISAYLQATIDHYLHQDAERKRAVLYNNCEIEIDEVKSENGSRVVYATVKNANNLPDYLFRAFYDHEFNEQTRNLVSCGIVVRKGRDNVTTHRYDFKSQQTILNSDANVGTESYFSFNIPELDDAPNFETYYLRPYLTSTRLRASNGDVSENYIKYGETYEYTCPIVVIDTISKKSGKHYESSSEYLIEVSVDATIEDIAGVTEWGIAFYTTGNNSELLKEETTTSNETPYTFNYKDFLDESYYDKKSNSIKLRAIPFAKGRNNNERAYGKAKDFEIKLADTSCPDSNHPHWIDLGLPSGTQWRCCNEGASTPEAYGGYYTFGQVSSAPTLDQIKEFLKYTTSEWTTLNGVYGRKFTSTINNGTVFLPAAGVRLYGGLYFVGAEGYYWSSTPRDEGSACELGIRSSIVYWFYYGLSGELSVRPVR